MVNTVFLLKKIIALLISPLSLSLEFLLAGFILQSFFNRQRMGRFLLGVGILVLVLVSFEPSANRFFAPLEQQYPSFNTAVLKNPSLIGPESPVKYIVVLGGGHVPDRNIPLTSRINGDALARLVEGISIQREIRGSKLILSGGGFFEPMPEAATMANIAIMLGVARKDIILETASRDTKDQAALILPLVGKERFVLVTSAWHMPRAMALFLKKGLHPVPAPTNYLARKKKALTPDYFFPDADNLKKSEYAVHEYLGMLWARLRNQVGR